jgi:hypothetical protein
MSGVRSLRPPEPAGGSAHAGCGLRFARPDAAGKNPPMISRAHLFLVSSVLVVPFTFVTLMPTGWSATTRSADPVVASGVLPDGFGIADVEAELAPAVTDATPVDATLPTFFIPPENISLDPDRRLVIRLAPSDVPAAFRWNDGMVNVQIHARGCAGTTLGRPAPAS